MHPTRALHVAHLIYGVFVALFFGWIFVMLLWGLVSTRSARR